MSFKHQKTWYCSDSQNLFPLGGGEEAGSSPPTLLINEIGLRQK